MHKVKSRADMQRESDNLRDELQVALLAAEDIKALRAKVSTLIERVREEKEGRLEVQGKYNECRGKLDMMGSHMEKLMNHLKVEAKQKSKLVASRRALRMELVELRAIAEKQQRIIETKNRYISELSEGSKLLEDQLRLMDDKYLDMRRKLDFAREQNRTEVVKAEKKASSLRRKFQAITGSKKLLDQVEVPETMATSMDSQRGVSWADYQSPARMSADKFGKSTKSLPPRAKSAPSKRSKVTATTSMVQYDAPDLDNILTKIDKKRQNVEGKWDMGRVKAVLAESEEAYSTTGNKRKTGIKKKQESVAAEPQDPNVFNTHISFTSTNNDQESHEVRSSSPQVRVPDSPMNRHSSFAILDRM